MFVKENLNPKEKKASDCAIRAIAKAEGKDWLTVYDELYELGRKMFDVPNSNKVIDKYLSKYEKLDVKYEDEYGNMKRFTVKDCCDFNGTLIVSVASHLTCVKNGNVFDTWDCSRKSAYKIWKIK